MTSLKSEVEEHIAINDFEGLGAEIQAMRDNLQYFAMLSLDGIRDIFPGTLEPKDCAMCLVLTYVFGQPLPLLTNVGFVVEPAVALQAADFFSLHHDFLVINFSFWLSVKKRNARTLAQINVKLQHLYAQRAIQHASLNRLDPDANNIGMRRMEARALYGHACINLLEATTSLDKLQAASANITGADVAPGLDAAAAPRKTISKQTGRLSSIEFISGGELHISDANSSASQAFGRVASETIQRINSSIARFQAQKGRTTLCPRRCPQWTHMVPGALNCIEPLALFIDAPCGTRKTSLFCCSPTSAPRATRGSLSPPAASPPTYSKKGGSGPSTRASRLPLPDRHEHAERPRPTIRAARLIVWDEAPRVAPPPH